MKQYRPYLFALIAILAVGLAVSACSKGGGDGRQTSSPSLFESPTAASNPAPAPAPAATPNPGVVGGRDGVQVELVSSNFADGRCTDLSLPEFQGINILEEVARVTNNTALEGYPKPALYQTGRATCDAHADNPAGQPVLDKLIIGENIPPGESREWTHRLELPPNFCGSFQFDNDFRNGEVAVSSLSGGGGGKVINSGRDCPDCELYGLQVIVTGEGLTKNVKVVFTHPKGNKTATVNYGDGSPEEVFNRNETKEHTFPYGKYTVTVRLEDRELPEACTNSVEVNTQEPCRVEWIELKPEVTYGEWGECTESDDLTASDSQQSCSRSRSHRTVIKEQNSCTEEVRVKSDETTKESRPCDCPCEEGWEELKPEITYGEWGDCEATEAFGASTTQSCSRSRSKRTVIKEQNSCTEEVRVKSDETTQESEPCECTTTCQVQVQPGRYCYDTPLGNGASECGAFGLTYQDKDDDLSGLTHTASQDATAAIVKDGSPHCYNVYADVGQGDILSTPNDGKDISHVTYCACPVIPTFQSATLLSVTEIIE